MSTLPSRALRAAVALIPALITLFAATLARADDTAAAQVLYERAVELMQQKKYSEACPKLEEVTRLVPEGMGAKLTLAECYEASGRTASAWTQYSFVEAGAARAGQADRQRLAAEKAAALKPRLAKLTIKVPDAVKSLPQLTVKRGGVAVGPAQFNEAIPIDVGTHVIEASAAGKKPWRTETKVPADGAQLAVEVPVLEDDPDARPGDPPRGFGAGDDSKPTWLFPVGLAVGGAGVAALAVGGALGGLAMSKTSDAQAACPNGLCSAAGNDLAVEAGTFADVATGLFVAGGVLAAGGVLMIALAPWDSEEAKPGAPPAKSALRLRVFTTGLGAGVAGEF